MLQDICLTVRSRTSQSPCTVSIKAIFADIEKLFKELVDNGDGTISEEGVTHLLRIAGNNPTQDDIDDMFDEIGTKSK